LIGLHHSAGFAFPHVLYTIRETQEELSGGAIIADQVEIAQIIQKGIRMLHHPSVNLLTANPVVATFAWMRIA
jgi:hypothetical protein